MYLSQFILRSLNVAKCSSVRSNTGKTSYYFKWFFHFVVIVTLVSETNGVELTFELPDNAKECFYEVIQEGKTSTVEFQVRTNCRNNSPSCLVGGGGPRISN